jgi:hypothetical protein
MSRVSPEPRTLPPADEREAVVADLRRQIDSVKAQLEEHRKVMRLAGLTGAENAESPQEP